MSVSVYFSMASRMPEVVKVLPSTGAGNRLPVWLLALCGAFTAVATGVSIMSITLQLKNYRKPALQRAVVRIMLMVPLYAISSLISIFSVEAAFVIDAIRDLYEAFVIYTFLQLLITYLGGERSLLIILHGRPPIPHPFPFNLFLNPMDVSDPWTLLNLKRGVLQYVQIKPMLVVAQLILKATGTYQEGHFAVDSGYTYVSIIYNTSICLSLYCLAMFWVAVNQDLKPFRPVPKFLCVKGILFFSFWQSIGISLLASTGAIKHVGPYTDAEHMSLALTDALICFEMPLFAIAHQYAFQASDYIDHTLLHAARLPFIYAFRDAFGFKDVWEDTKDTIRGRGISYQAYEPAEGTLHHDIGRQKRIRAGLRYSKGGKAKYWLPIPGDEARGKGETGPLTAVRRRMDERLAAREGFAPLLPKQAAVVLGEDPDAEDHQPHGTHGLFESDSDESDAPSLDFESVHEDEDDLYERARRIGYAGFPNVDVSKEEKMRRLREEEDGILAGRWNRGGGSRERRGMDRSNSKNDIKGKGKAREINGKKAVYGAWADRGSVSPIQRRLSEQSYYRDNDDGRKSRSGGSQYHHANGGSDRAHPGTYRSKSSDGDAEANHAQNLRKHLRRSKQMAKDFLSPPSPHVLGDDDEEEEEDDNPNGDNGKTPHSPLPPDAVDLVVEDEGAVEQARERERRKGEPQTKAPVHVYLHMHPNGRSGALTPVTPQVQEVFSPDGAEETRRSDTVVADQEPHSGAEAKGGAAGIDEYSLIPDEEYVSSTGNNRNKAAWQASNGSYDDGNPWA